MPKPTAAANEASANPAQSADAEAADLSREQEPATGPASPDAAPKAKTPPSPVPRPMAQPTAAPVKTSTAPKPVSAPKQLEKSAAPPPAAPRPSLPASMIVRPHSQASASGSSAFAGELDESFESALARVEQRGARHSIAGRILGRIRELMSSGGNRAPVKLQRKVAFDGFRDDLFEDKRERDRRYGTIYTVWEEVNAFVVRLELPRQMPKSSLKQTWELSDEMPDYLCTLNLVDNVLAIRAGLPDEARRRLSYVSSSFPSDFQTRIEFPTPVGAYKHRLQDKVLEIIVFKKPGFSLASTSPRQELQG
jgi:hypothetical protein